MNSQNPMIDNNDPRLTAYALGELAPADVVQIEAALESSPELRAVVADIRRASETISNVFLTEPPLQLTSEQKSQLLIEAESASNFDVRPNKTNAIEPASTNLTPAVADEHDQLASASASSGRWLKIAIAAGLASLLIGGGFYFSRSQREPMAASDHDVFESEALKVGDEASEIRFEAPQALPPTGERKLSKSKGIANPNPTAEPFEQSPLVAQKSAEPFKRSSDLSEGTDAAAIWESDALSDRKMPRSQGALAGAGPPTVNRSRPKNSMQKPIAENSVADAINNDRDAKVNSDRLLLAQKSIDQSILGALNLTVVARNSPGGGFGGGEFGGGGATRSKLSPPDLPDASKKNLPSENFAGEKSLALESGKEALSLPATFALQISDQEAKQMVELLASYADPLKQRKLSFDDLIGSPAFSLSAQDAEYDDHQPNGGNKKSEGSSAFENRPAFYAYSPASSAAQRQVAAAMLAIKLRGFVGQSSLVKRDNNVRSIAPDNATDGVAGLPQTDSPSASATQTPSGGNFGGNFKSPATKSDAKIIKQELAEDLDKAGVFGNGQAGPDSKPMTHLQSLNEFDFDYSQIIQQLKSNLEIRNQALQDLK